MAVDYFLKLDGIEGESVDTGHKKEIMVLQWSWGASNISSVGSSGGSGAGKVNPSEFSVITYFDKATPKFWKSICRGTHIATGTMSAVKAGTPEGKPYLTVDFKEIFVTGLQMSGTNETPSVNLQFTYNECKIEYSQQDGKGNLTSTGAVTYNRAENKTS
jgi:type VI secretion system secreted protein Hcp